jgi:hypothetical protein
MEPSCSLSISGIGQEKLGERKQMIQDFQCNGIAERVAAAVAILYSNLGRLYPYRPSYINSSSQSTSTLQTQMLITMEPSTCLPLCAGGDLWQRMGFVLGPRWDRTMLCWDHGVVEGRKKERKEAVGFTDGANIFYAGVYSLNR